MRTRFSIVQARVSIVSNVYVDNVIPIFRHTPSKDGMFLQRRVRICYNFRETFGRFFSNSQTKNQPFGFHFSKGTENKLRVWIHAIFRGGGGGGFI